MAGKTAYLSDIEGKPSGPDERPFESLCRCVLTSEVEMGGLRKVAGAVCNCGYAKCGSEQPDGRVGLA